MGQGQGGVSPRAASVPLLEATPVDLRPRAASVPLLEASRGVGVGKSSRGLGALAGGTMAGHGGGQGGCANNVIMSAQKEQLRTRF